MRLARLAWLFFVHPVIVVIDDQQLRLMLLRGSCDFLDLPLAEQSRRADLPQPERLARNHLHANRADFIQKVQEALMTDLDMNGFQLESVSITHFDQTAFEHFNENNAFDAEGLTVLTRTIEERKKILRQFEKRLLDDEAHVIYTLQWHRIIPHSAKAISE